MNVAQIHTETVKLFTLCSGYLQVGKESSTNFFLLKVEEQGE